MGKKNIYFSNISHTEAHLLFVLLPHWLFLLFPLMLILMALEDDMSEGVYWRADFASHFHFLVS